MKVRGLYRAILKSMLRIKIILLKSKSYKKWYQEKAKKFAELVHEYEQIVKEEVNNIRVITMQTRWGSCNVESGNINLNLELIKSHVIVLNM